jgi:hypothetical protein
VICAARARARLCCARALLVPSYCLLPSLTHFPCFFRPPQVYPDATGAAEGGSRLVVRFRAGQKRQKDSDYEQSLATSQSEDSSSDVTVRRRVLSSVSVTLPSDVSAAYAPPPLCARARGFGGSAHAGTVIEDSPGALHRVLGLRCPRTLGAM